MIMPRKRTERKVKRYEVNWAVKKLNGKLIELAQLLDISSLGTRLEANQGLAPRNLVEILVDLPGEGKEVKLSGQVMWMRPLVESPGRFQIGVKFFNANWEIDRLVRAGKI